MKEMNEEFKVGDDTHNLSLGFTAITLFSKKMKELLPKKLFCMSMKIFAYYVNCQFNLKNNEVHIAEEPLTEISVSHLRTRVKAAFISSGPPNPNDKSKYLQTEVPAWPPYYLPIMEFQDQCPNIYPDDQKEFGL